jgi:hypothetical protein
MYEVRNNRELSKHFIAKVDGATAVIVDLEGAAGFLRKYGNDGLHWQTTGNAIQAADADPKLIDHATNSFENALRTERLL